MIAEEFSFTWSPYPTWVPGAVTCWMKLPSTTRSETVHRPPSWHPKYMAVAVEFRITLRLTVIPRTLALFATTAIPAISENRQLSTVMRPPERIFTPSTPSLVGPNSRPRMTRSDARISKTLADVPPYTMRGRASGSLARITIGFLGTPLLRMTHGP